MISLQEQIATALNLKGIGVFEPYDTTGNIFIDIMPIKPVNAIAIYMTIVDEPNFAHDEQAVTIQCLVRSVNKHEAMETGASIIRLLNGFNGGPFVHGGHYIVDTQAQTGLPVYLGTNEAGQHECSISFEIEYIKEEIRYGY